MRYIPHTEEEVKAMLARIGVANVDALFDNIPEGYRLDRPLNVPASLDEASLMRHLTEVADANTHPPPHRCFAGAGAYAHHIPPAVDQLLLRGEFYTAYTPYQAEVAQGTLQAMFEFQTIVAELFGMEVANASMYDLPSALAEAVLMARRINGRSRIVAAETLHPHTIETLRSYLRNIDGGTPKLDLVPAKADGSIDTAALGAALNDEVAAVAVGYPNVLGCVEPLAQVAQLAHDVGALAISTTAEAYALGLLAPPGRCGVDIAVGEGQSLAAAPNFGGPGVGLFACRQGHLRQMPGRIVGETVDADGERGYVLTLSTREQHIRREKATSNICTNHGLMALALTIRTAMLGPQGLRDAAEACAAKARYLRDRLTGVPGITFPHGAPYFHEFVFHSEQRAQKIRDGLADQGFLAGVPMIELDSTADPRAMLVCCTEVHTRADIDAYVDALRTFVS